MHSEKSIAYLDYNIRIVLQDARFVAYVSRDGRLIEHDGRASEVWVSASCVSCDRAVWVAKNAIDTDRIR